MLSRLRIATIRKTFVRQLHDSKLPSVSNKRKNKGKLIGVDSPIKQNQNLFDKPKSKKLEKLIKKTKK